MINNKVEIIRLHRIPDLKRVIQYERLIELITSRKKHTYPE